MRRVRILSVLALGALLSASGSATATIYVVKPDGTGDFPTIQEAVNAAEDGDVIELADGIFRGDGNRDVSYLGKAITVRSQSGSPETCIIDPEGAHPDARHRGFLFESGEASASVLEAVTITNGYAGGGDHGGGVLCIDGSSPTISRCVFTMNTATSGGGGLCCKDETSPTIVDCIFSENVCVEAGGGGVLSASSNPALIRCQFIGNQASTGGGLRFGTQFFANSIVTDCSFYDNVATSRGGGIEASHAGFTATGCVFVGNSCPNGGAVYLRGYSTSMTDCFFSGNSGTLGGAIICTGSSTPEFAGCTFVANGGGFGGALASYDSEPSASQCTFVSNTATSAGGGLYLWDSALSLENCIVVFSGQGEAVTCGGVASASLSCCDLFGNAGGDWVGCVADQSGTNGNISEDPLFCGSQNPEDPYTLHEDSPCAPEGNPECGLMGAWPVACGPASGTPDREPVGRVTTWGLIKAGTRN